jgi:2-dehydro-3-deoxyphosphooctonate aldolase (KDO 8-P synthase)
VDFGHGVTMGGGEPLVVIAGLCVIESPDHTLRVAEELQRITRRVGCGFVFKASYDKANRSSAGSYRGPGMEKGLRALEAVRSRLGVPVLSDVHDVSQVTPAAQVLDCIQIPAFLSRQTDLLVAAGASGKPVNVKKGQFLAPADMGNAVAKVVDAGGGRVVLTERGTTFGYGNLVVDFRGLEVMRGFGWPVVFDATHSVQLPGGQGGASGGEARFIPGLAAAAAAVGVDGLFFEVHENPAAALSDGPNTLRLGDFEGLLVRLVAIRDAARG